ncbi:hypothetical protein ACTA71_004993 [Dictyostelium dimigraforme]
MGNIELSITDLSNGEDNTQLFESDWPWLKTIMEKQFPKLKGSNENLEHCKYLIDLEAKAIMGLERSDIKFKEAKSMEELVVRFIEINNNSSIFKSKPTNNSNNQINDIQTLYVPSFHMNNI